MTDMVDRAQVVFRWLQKDHVSQCFVIFKHQRPEGRFLNHFLLQIAFRINYSEGLFKTVIDCCLHMLVLRGIFCSQCKSGPTQARQKN